jgi:hypothetical protein
MAIKGEDAELLVKINTAVAAANSAEQNAETAKAELVSRSKEVGVLLLEAKQRHPAVKDFEAFLKKVDGLKLSRAYDLLRLAGGRTTDEELRKETRDRVKKHRANKKLPKAKPEPEASQVLLESGEVVIEAVSVTSPDVTEAAEASAEARKAEYADVDAKPDLTSSPNGDEAEKRDAQYAESNQVCRALQKALAVIVVESNWPALSASKRKRRDKVIREFRTACFTLSDLAMSPPYQKKAA